MRYGHLTEKSSTLMQRSLQVTPGGVHSPVRAFKGVGGVPRFIESAKGAYLRDVDNNLYLDYCMSWGPLIFGHQDPEIRESINSALSRGWTYGTAEPYSLELAEFITQSIPWVEKVRFVNSGTEAVMSALRLARAATGRSVILKFDGCYHGHVDSLLVRAGSGLAEMASPDSAGISKAVAAETIVVPLDDLESFKKALDQHGDSIAAVIIEPLPANNGLLLQSPDFLSQICVLARAKGALVIFDEVISGFRVALGGMAERTGLRPDLVTYGKIIGGGFPVGAYGGRADLMDLIAPSGPVYQAGTLSANPVAMSAGLATLKKLKREKPYEKLETDTEHLARALEQAAHPWAPGLRVQNFASIFWMVDSGTTQSSIIRRIDQIPEQNKPRYARLYHALLEHSVYLAPSAFEVGFVSTAHTQEDHSNLSSALAHALKHTHEKDRA